MPDTFLYYATSRLGTKQVYPVGKMKVAWEKDDDDFRIGYSEKLGNDLIFQGADFDWFYSLEKTVFRCEYIFLSIYKYCNGNYIEDWKKSKISLNRGKWDIDTCKVSFTSDEDDKYACYNDNKDTKLNLLSYVTADNLGTTQMSGGTIEFYDCTRTYEVGGVVQDPEPCPQPQGNEWSMIYEKIVIVYSTGRTEQYRYARLNMGDGTYQPAITFDPVTTYTQDDNGSVGETTWAYIGSSNIATTLDNGMKLKACFDAFVGEFCEGLTLKSDFFQWNPDVVSDINYVTGETSKVLNLYLYQKSDVQRPNVSNNATIAEITFADLLNNICTIFNLKWDIIGTDFRIEHYSYWNKNQGLDLTIPRYAKNILFEAKYTYATDKLKKFEKFKFMEAEGYEFIGRDIYYDSACVANTSPDDNTKLYEADLITTDIAYVMSHPNTSGEDDTISDEGFCLIACNADNVIITEAPILNFEYRLNNSLAWSHLHRDYYKHGRMQLKGYMNDQPTDFISSIATKKQTKLTIPLCCDDVFDPFDLVTTQLGSDGNVDSATYDLTSETLELNLIFNAELGLIDDDGPVANDDIVITDMNTPVDIPVLTNDTDVSGIIDPDTITIITPAGHGTVTSNGDGTFKYTPNTDYVGDDFFTYTVKDNWAVESNIAHVYITVIQTALANDDFYTTVQNVTYFACCVLANDLGTGLTIIANDSTTSNGGTIIMSLIDGAFEYHPPTDFIGEDTFEYTIQDAGGNTSTATVHINVIEQKHVYVHLLKTVVSSLPTNSCEPPNGAYIEKSDITLYFYEDSAGTIPLDTTGYSLSIGTRETSIDNHAGTSSDTDNSISPSGTSKVWQTEVVTHLDLKNCDGSYGGNDHDYIFSLLPGTGYTVI